MTKADLLVVMGCAPYTKATVDACRIAHKRNIAIIAITDSPNSPLTQYAQQQLLIPTESDYYSNSMAASFALAEALLAMTAQEMGQSAVNNLKVREQLIEEFGISIDHANH